MARARSDRIGTHTTFATLGAVADNDMSSNAFAEHI